MDSPRSFELPLPDGDGPVHERLAEALENLVATGGFDRGDRLPTHREIARAANVAIGTVTKAIDLLVRRGVVRSETGRGTFVNLPVEAPDQIIDLSFNAPLPVLGEAVFREAATRAAMRLGTVPNGGYPDPGGSREQRETMRGWLAELRTEVDADDLLITIGGQHAIHLAMADLAELSPVVATEGAIFSGAIAVARQLGLQLAPVAHDEEGMLPAALDRVLRETGCRAVYLTPVCQNPFGFETGRQRREQLLEICLRHDAFIVEDDVYCIYSDGRARPLRELAPARVYYINSLSKSLTPLLRVGLLVAPTSRRVGLAARIRAEVWGASPFDLEVARALFEAGQHLSARDMLIAEARERTALAQKILKLKSVPMPQGAPHLWLPMRLSEAENLARRALENGIRVTPPDATVVGGDNAAGIRLCLMAPAQRSTLERGLAAIRDLFRTASLDVV